MKAGLTKRESEALAFIAEHIASKGFSPSYREIARAVGVQAPSCGFRLVHALIKRGHLVTVGHSARSVALTEPAADPRQFIRTILPVLVDIYGPDHPRVVEARELS